MGNEKNLIPLNQRHKEDAKAIQSKGGKATKGIRKYKQMSCSRCKLPCPFKEQGAKEKWRCKVPDLKRAVMEGMSDPEQLKRSLFADAFDLQTTAKTFADKEKVFGAKMRLKQEFFPTPNVNLHGIQGDITVKIIEEDA